MDKEISKIIDKMEDEAKLHLLLHLKLTKS